AAGAATPAGPRRAPRRWNWRWTPRPGSCSPRSPGTAPGSATGTRSPACGWTEAGGVPGPGERPPAGYGAQGLLPGKRAAPGRGGGYAASRPGAAPESGPPVLGCFRSCTRAAPRGAGLDHALGQHRLGDLLEAGDVGADHVVAGPVVELGGGVAGVVDVPHHRGQPLLGVAERPGVPGGVLLHLQGDGGDPARVGRLARAERDAGLLEDPDALRGGRHVGALGDRLHAVADQGAGVGRGELVLRGAGQRHVARHLPDPAAGHVAGVGAAPLGVVGDPAALDLLDLLEQVEVDALLVHHVAGGVGGGDHGRAELPRLLDRIDRDVARAGDRDPLPLQVLVAHPQHLRGEQHAAVPGGLGAHPRPAPGEALAGEHARLVAVGDPLVLPEQVADLPAADADVARGDVGVLAEVPVELGHEGLAEPHDLGVRAALGVEVAAALAAPDGHAGERVLEDLLEAEELHDAQVHRRVEPQAALVRAQGAVELDPEPAVDVHLAGVVGPRDAEDDLPLRLGDPLDQLGLDELRTLGQHRAERLQD